MPLLESHAIELDYGPAASAEVVGNISGIAARGDGLWTVSDEGRSLESLVLRGGRYVLARQYHLDEILRGVPGRRKGDEMDLETLDIADGVLWICGSHARVRRKPSKPELLNPEIRSRPSRRVLIAASLRPEGIAEARLLPTKGKGSLRRELRRSPYLAPFIDLPSKENGLDIEALAVVDGQPFIGLRGPTLDSFAVVARLDIGRDFEVRDHDLAFLDLGGLAIRELCRHRDRLLVLAGPTSDAPGPYRLYSWLPRVSKLIQSPRLLFAWPEIADKPEGLCPDPGAEDALIVVYDSVARSSGTIYHADRLRGL